ncbi:GATA transcription factor 5-like [Senna tora]|uniref:Small nuclear ribonucleoprotein G n=1 Tax=Senna tora TaxID=362788 RepID=A0A834TZN0_9FABA|nr:GATA transcription factor 5-like [Senna tora]
MSGDHGGGQTSRHNGTKPNTNLSPCHPANSAFRLGVVVSFRRRFLLGIFHRIPRRNLNALDQVCSEAKPPPKKPKKIPAPDAAAVQAPRRCTHCGVHKTPQWRTGPLGAKTLCNACGVRFKSGRLLPEYRPACSPTFSSELHSNHHRKVLEMRRKKEGTAGVDPVKLNANRMIIGTLRGFDQFMNLVVDNTVEVNGNEKTDIGMVVIRGNSVVTVEALEPVNRTQ